MESLEKERVIIMYFPDWLDAEVLRTLHAFTTYSLTFALLSLTFVKNIRSSQYELKIQIRIHRS